MKLQQYKKLQQIRDSDKQIAKLEQREKRFIQRKINQIEKQQKLISLLIQSRN